VRHSSMTCGLFLALMLLIPFTWAQDSVVSPLLIRNTSPAALLFGVPVMRSSAESLALSIDRGNIFSGDLGDNSLAAFDGETMLTHLSYNQTFADVWSWGVDIPWVRHDGGFLDSFIDGYHDGLGFGSGGRDLVRRDRLLYSVQVGGQTVVDLRHSEQDLGDVRLYLGHSLLDTSNRSLAVHGLVKLPTGSVDSLSGSEAMDAGAWLEYGQVDVFGLSRLSMTAMVGGMYLGKGELLPELQRDFMPVGHLGFGYQVHDRVQLLMQADAQGAPFDVDLSLLGRTGLQGTLGGRVFFKPSLWLDLGIVEDLYSSSSPDVIFHLSLHGRLGAD
jgi:Protein of unknown function (DUF3187)